MYDADLRVVPGGSPGREPGSRPEGDGNAVSLHGLTSITLGVPDVDAVASHHEDFGLRRGRYAGSGAGTGPTLHAALAA
jgi:hypothetical protein